MFDIFEDMIYCCIFLCGMIQVICDQGEVLFDDLFDIVERCNLKCVFLFVSKVFGRYIFVLFLVMWQVYRQFVSQFFLILIGFVLFIGMVEIVVGFGVGVFDEVCYQYCEFVYLIFICYLVDGMLFCEFKEEYSYVIDYLIYLLDDEEKRCCVINV